MFAVGRGGAARRRLPIAGKAPASCYVCLDAAGAHEQNIPKTRDTTSRNSLGFIIAGFPVRGPNLDPGMRLENHVFGKNRVFSVSVFNMKPSAVSLKNVLKLEMTHRLTTAINLYAQKSRVAEI